MKKKRHLMLRKGLETIAKEYATFLQELHKKSESLYDPRELCSLSEETRKILKDWLKDQLNKIQDTIGEKNSESQNQEGLLTLLKEKYDKILDAGTCTSLLGKSPKIVTEALPAFELFSAYHEFLEAGLCRELTRKEIEALLEKSREFLNIDVKDRLNIPKNKEKEIFRNLDSMKNKNVEFEKENEEVLNKNIKFKQEVMTAIRILVPLLGATKNQKDFILKKTEEILNKHISRAQRNEITIRKDAKPSKNAAAIIYAVTVSNEYMPKISGEKLSAMVGTRMNEVSRLYNTWYKDLSRKLDFDFKNVPLGRSRMIMALFFFELLIYTEIETSEIVLSLKEFIIESCTNRDILKEHNLLKQFTEEEINVYQDMAINYSETFSKYFSDFVNMIKLLIVSNKYHKLIGAEFSILHFIKFFVREKGITLFLTEDGLRRIFRGIFDYFREKYPNLFPNRLTKGSGESKERDRKKRDVVGNRLKLYIMKHIYNGRYFDEENGIAICPECKREGFTMNTSFPRVRSKDFHHEDIRLEGYTTAELYYLFTKNRGNPYFLPELIEKMESESVILLCGCHHSLIHSTFFNNFKKLISWEDIPKEFPYNDIFDLPADIIHILIKICVDNFCLTQGKNKEERRQRRKGIIFHLKKRYIIDFIYGGFCPVCGEFNSKDHLPVFGFGHLYKLIEMTLDEIKEFGREKKIARLYEGLSCSEIAKELARQKGGYICHNCHFVTHKNISTVGEIYDDQNIIREVVKDIEQSIKKYNKQNLINSRLLIRDPLKPEISKYKSFMEYLIALFEISDRKKRRNEEEGVTRDDMLDYLERIGYDNIFEKRELSKKYLNIIDGRGRSVKTKYYINDEGRRIVRLMYYFRDYYRNLTP